MITGDARRFEHFRPGFARQIVSMVTADDQDQEKRGCSAAWFDATPSALISPERAYQVERYESHSSLCRKATKSALK
jgi:hypothetical protein